MRRRGVCDRFRHAPGVTGRAFGRRHRTLLTYNRRLYDRAVELGGTQYPISAVRLDPADWVRHYGAQFRRLVRAKARFDPADVLASGPDVLGHWTRHGR